MNSRNPYTDRAVIRDISHFYGRKLEISRIYSRIGAYNPQSVSIVGDRHIGKSSLLYFIYNEENRKKYLDEPESYIFVLMDLQEEPKDNIPSFIESLLSSISESLGQKVKFGGRNEYDALKRLAMELRRQKRKLIMLFDEFELITQNEAFDPSFYAFFRGLASNYDISFVTSSVRDLQELCSVKAIANSPFFNIFSKIHLGPFRESEAIELIEKPSSKVGCPLSKYKDAILSMSGMIPIFIQIACSAFIEYLQVNGKVTGERDIKEIEEFFWDEASPHFRYIWDILDNEAKNVSQEIIAGEEIDEDRKNVVNDLIRRGYVLEEGKQYKLFSKIFAEQIVASGINKLNSKPLKTGQRRSEAIVVIDVCNHLSMMERLGEEGWMKILESLDSIVREASAYHECQYLASRGDGYLATFSTPFYAVSAVSAILSKTKDYNQRLEENKRVFLRFCINCGETVIGPSGDRQGERVNETFRMESLRNTDMPEWGGNKQEFPQRDYILATERIYNEMKDSKELNFELLGIFELRGLPGLHRIYEITSTGLT